MIRPAPGELEQLLADWKANRTPYHAANLVDLALVLGRREVAEDAARYLISNPVVDWGVETLADAVLGRRKDSAGPSTPSGLRRQDRYIRIARCRASLRLHPRNPILLVELAREYTVLGQLGPAERALKQAIALAPSDRFALRAASRFFLHARQPDRSQWLLHRSDRARVDPWLLAAEIAAADAGGKISRWISRGRAALDQSNFSPRATTELASAIATVELRHGSQRQVRLLFDRALVDPTDNSVAQAAWISRRVPSLVVPDTGLQLPLAFEARAWHSALDRRYTEAISGAWDWLRDEPWGTRAPLFGSWLASTAMGDFVTGAALVEAARPANPADPRLLAQLIYCLASSGRPDEAEVLLVHDLPMAIRTYPDLSSRAQWDVLIEADRGLIAYRRGRAEEGRLHYEAALQLAKAPGMEQFHATALLNAVRERALVDPAAMIPMDEVHSALASYPAAVRPVYSDFVGRILGDRKVLHIGR